ncbi:MAG: NarK/NasA family nitrate transporter [Actinobacteria bacterium]|nr:NarK/NasA family nitrate transporter [Actinomycetota bacterium]
MSKGAKGSTRVLSLSTFAFTLMFAVWLMFGVLGIPIQKEFGLSDSQLAWLSSVAILNGSIWRLFLGVLTDRIGGKRVTIVMLLVTSIPAYLLAHMTLNYNWLLTLAFLVGFAGNLFSVGIAWNSHWFERERQGFALGVFGAGNIGASATKFIGPVVIASTVGGSYFGGIIPGGWRFVPALYSVLLIFTAVAILLFTPADSVKIQAARPLKDMFKPLKYIQVWRFSLYYVVMFGAYVALASWMPKYFVSVYKLDLRDAALLTALFIFPASLLRPFGGHLSDKMGARRLMYASFGTMLVALLLLAAPFGHIVLETQSGLKRVLPYSLGVFPFTVLLFIVGCSMGIGKAAVYKHIPEYFPKDVGAVGGLVGTLGALGGFLLPPLFVSVREWTGIPQSTFIVLFILTLVASVWMHLTIVRLMYRATPQLEHRIDTAAQELLEKVGN